MASAPSIKQFIDTHEQEYTNDVIELGYLIERFRKQGCTDPRDRDQTRAVQTANPRGNRWKLWPGLSCAAQTALGERMELAATS